MFEEKASSPSGKMGGEEKPIGAGEEKQKEGGKKKNKEGSGDGGRAESRPGRQHHYC
ncbi:TARS isoform 11 [Pongo abelii]|uniref:TARS isoform 11 n=1 Tax=Pongo abelii TaxID=9601 RepID=A0A2J8WAV3_PONAB|nr:TARS isoform 5 [Pongo abelii]PNJ66910.1 TARS isoform 11 [Pongo abelii]